MILRGASIACAVFTSIGSMFVMRVLMNWLLVRLKYLDDIVIARHE